MNGSKLIEMPRLVSAQETRESVVRMAKHGSGPRRIAKVLGIDETEVVGYVLLHAELRFRQGRERGRLDMMPNLPPTGRAVA